MRAQRVVSDRTVRFAAHAAAPTRGCKPTPSLMGRPPQHELLAATPGPAQLAPSGPMCFISLLLIAQKTTSIQFLYHLVLSSCS